VHKNRNPKPKDAIIQQDNRNVTCNCLRNQGWISATIRFTEASISMARVSITKIQFFSSISKLQPPPIPCQTRHAATGKSRNVTRHMRGRRRTARGLTLSSAICAAACSASFFLTKVPGVATERPGSSSAHR
jgi:hypothetical protein